MTEFEEKYKGTYKLVLKEIEDALEAADTAAIERLVEDISNAENVFFIGVGRVMMSLEAFAKRLSHLGVHTHCVGSVTEPAITDRDILIVGSGSGESIVPVVIARKAREVGVKRIIHIGSNPKGAISAYADYMVRIPVQTRLYLPDEIPSEQIMTSLFEQTLLILGDVISKMIVDTKGIDLKELWQYHANLE